MWWCEAPSHKKLEKGCRAKPSTQIGYDNILRKPIIFHYLIVNYFSLLCGKLPLQCGSNICRPLACYCCFLMR